MTTQYELTCLFFFSLLLSCTQSYSPPRHPNITVSAKWIGGTDGGSWFSLVNIVSQDTFNIRVFNDQSGDMSEDTIFVLDKDCKFLELDSMMLMNYIDFYDGHIIGLKKTSKNGTFVS